MPAPVTVLHDGDCAFCAAAAAWLVRRARGGVVAIPLGEAGRPGSPLAARLAGRDLAATLHVVLAGGEIRTGAAAVLAGLRALPRWGRLVAVLDRPAGHRLLAPGYRLLAAHRDLLGRLLRLPATCATPEAARRDR